MHQHSSDTHARAEGLQRALPCASLLRPQTEATEEFDDRKYICMAFVQLLNALSFPFTRQLVRTKGSPSCVACSVLQAPFPLTPSPCCSALRTAAWCRTFLAACTSCSSSTIIHPFIFIRAHLAPLLRLAGVLHQAIAQLRRLPHAGPVHALQEHLEPVSDAF